jgi:hypothetical protein
MQEHMRLLGLKVRDAVTGFKGVVVTISFDLFGCVQAVVMPPVFFEASGEPKLEESRWFDVKRLEVTDDHPVMILPTFADGTVDGGQDLSAVRR